MLKNNGSLMPVWPKHTDYGIYSPPAVGFIDGDNILDLAIGDGGGTIHFQLVMKLYAWNKNGRKLQGSW
jgi:hypothetical protein